MSLVAIVGAGEIGAAAARALAGRSRVDRVRLIDERTSVASGKALEEYTPAERQQYQITESYDPLPVFGAALPAPAVLYAGPDFSA